MVLTCRTLFVVVVRVGVGCADPRLAAGAAAVVIAAGSTVVEFSGRPPPGLGYLVLDEVAAATLSVAPVGLAGIAIVVAASPIASTWALAVRLRALVVALPEGESLLLDALLSAVVSSSRSSTLLVAVLGTTGGCGATTIAAGLAFALARRDRPCALVDLDRLGGGLDLALGAERSPGARWPDLVGGSLASSLVDLPVVDGVRLVSWDRRPSPPPPIELVLSVIAALRADMDVVVDLSRSMLVSHAELAADRVIVVSAQQVRAAAATALVVADLGDAIADLVVTAVPPVEIAAQDLASAVDFPLLATFSARLHRRTREFDRLAADWSLPA